MRLVVSPHLDDAVLSCGSYLEASADPVLTVFDGLPGPTVLTAYDREAGFESSLSAVDARQREDEAALASLGCERGGLGLLDRQYGVLPVMHDIALAIIDAAAQAGADGLVGPLGLQHPDHLVTSDACLRAAAKANLGLWLYEELPYRVVWPELAFGRLARLGAQGWRLHPDFLGGGPTEAKLEAIRRYRSQAIDVHCCLAPERYWQVMG